MRVKVFLGGEGKNDIGTRAQTPMGDQPGVVEALLRKLRPDGWHVAGAMEWKSIRKYRAGAAKHRADHADVHNIEALIERAYEQACEMLVFVRDVDGEPLREAEIRRLLTTLDLGSYPYPLGVAGGIAKPTLEAWILHLHGIANTDALTRAAAERKLGELGITLKSSDAYLAVVEACEPLPTGDGSLCEWLEQARTLLIQLIDGTA
jgi:hypothetical protein